MLITLALAGLLLCLAAVAALRSPYLAVETITVRGNLVVSREDAIATSGVVVGTSMLRVRPSAATAALAALPRVASAQVRLVWPRGVDVLLVERTSLLVLPCGDGWLEVATDGTVLALHDAAAGAELGLFALQGLGPAQVAVGRSVPGPGSAAVVAVLASLEAMGEGITGAELASGNLTVGLTDGTQLLLGQAGGDLPGRAALALGVLAEMRAAGRPVLYIDARLPGQPVIKLK